LSVGQAVLVALIGSCLLLEPSSVAIKRGLSFYGNDPLTIVPYTSAFVFAIACSTIGLLKMREAGSDVRRVRATIGAVLSLMVAIPLTPYSIDIVFDWFHIGATVVLFSAGFALGAWIAFRVARATVTCVLFGVEAAAAVAVLTAQIGLQNYMLPGELVFQVGVSTLIVRAVRVVARRAYGDAPSRLRTVLDGLRAARDRGPRSG
jgi:hypothetical protein